MQSIISLRMRASFYDTERPEMPALWGFSAHCAIGTSPRGAGSKENTRVPRATSMAHFTTVPTVSNRLTRAHRATAATPSQEAAATDKYTPQTGQRDAVFDSGSLITR